MKVKEIKAQYKILHDQETALHYSGQDGRAKEEWDTWHGQLWTDCENQLKTASDYVEAIKPRDLAAEIDELKARVDSMEKP